MNAPQTIQFGQEKSFDKNWSAPKTLPFGSQNSFTRPQSPFNPNSPNSQFVDPNKSQPGTTTASKFVGSLAKGAKDTFVTPEQNLLATAGTRIAQAGVSVAEPLLPKNIQQNIETNLQKPQQQLGVTVQPQQQGMAGAKQIGAQALTAADAIGNVALAGEAIPKAINLAKTGANAISAANESAIAANQAKNAVKESASTWKMIQPELSKADLAKAVKSGDIATKGRLGTVTQIAKGRNAQMVEAAKPFVSTAKDPIEAVSNMQQGIVDEAQKLRQGLQQSTATWSQNNLKGAISKVIKSSDNLVGDSAAAFKKTTNAVLSEATKADKNLSGLLDVRQKFDARVQAQYPNIYDSSNSAIKVAVTKTRSAINQMIEDALPNGTTIDGVSFRDSLKKQSLLYDAIDNTAPKTGKLGTNKITQWIKDNPRKSTAIGTLGVGEVAKKLGIIP